MHMFTSHRDGSRRYFAHFDLPTHPLCWLRGHRAKAEVIDSKYVESWVLVTCRTCGIRHNDPYMTGGKFVSLERDKEAAAKKALERQIDAARHNNTSFARVRDGRDGYGHHRVAFSLEVTPASWRKPGLRLHVGDRWSETPFDGSVHGREWSAYFSVGGVGNRLAERFTRGEKRDLSVGAGYRDD